MNHILSRFSHLVEDLSHETDGRLVATFLTGSHAAFRELVDRHSSLVFGVCYRILRHQQDAEDAFQAVFIILARRAADVWPQDAVGSWLFGVAYRVALKSRIRRARHRLREQAAEEVAQQHHSALEHDITEIIHRVLAKLPEVYRAAIITCDLEGLSRKDAAKQLGWTEGTLSGRLARARRLLANRLRKVGVTCPAAGVASVLGTAASVEARLADEVMNLASTASEVPASVAALTHGVISSRIAFKVKAVTAILVASAVGFGAWAVVPGDGIEGNKDTLNATALLGTQTRKLEAADTSQGVQLVQEEPKPIPPEVVRAWEKAGASVRSAEPNGFDFSTRPAMQYYKTQPLKNRELLVFSLSSGVKKVSGLPAPEVPFGIAWCFITDEQLKQLAEFKQLQWLRVSSSEEVTDAGLKTLSALKQLRSLSLEGTQVTDTGLRELSAFKQLRSLELRRMGVTNKGLKELSTLKQLQSLYLESEGITDAGLKELSALKELQTLDLTCSKVTDVGIKELVAFKHLKRLSLWNTQVTNVGLKELSTLKELQSLELSSSYEITDVGLKELSALKQLQTLNLSRTRITDVGMKEVSVLKQLQTLDLTYADVTATGLKQIAELTQLKTLNLSNTLVRDSCLEELATLKQLHTLDLSGTLVKNLDDIGTLKQLQVLNLSETRVAEWGLRKLSVLKQLRSLDLTGTKVTDESMKTLSTLKQLQWLDLTGTSLTDVSLKHLSTLKELRLLDLSGTHVTLAGVDELRKALPECTIRGGE